MSAADRARGKVLELTVGRALGGRRRHSGEGIMFDDVVMPDGTPFWLSIEAKAGYERPCLRKSWIEQARRNADGRPWAIVQRPKRSRTIYVTLDFDTVKALAAKAGLVPGYEAEAS